MHRITLLPTSHRYNERLVSKLLWLRMLLSMKTSLHVFNSFMRKQKKSGFTTVVVYCLAHFTLLFHLGYGVCFKVPNDVAAEL